LSKIQKYVTAIILFFLIFMVCSNISGESLEISSEISYKLYPIADAYVDEYHPNSNYGSIIELQAGKTSSYPEPIHFIETYLKFDLTSLPAEIEIYDVDLYLYCSSSIQTGTINLCQVNDDSWSEGGITWNNKPASVEVLDSNPFASANTWDVYNSLDLTTFVSQTYNGDKIVSFRLHYAGTTDWCAVKWYSKEYGTEGFRPYLWIHTRSALPPEAAFSASPTSGVIPLEVSFTDKSTGTIDTWSWDFGDGATSTEQNPTHTYRVYGNYTVTLTVSGSKGSDTETKVNYIIAQRAPAGEVARDTLTGTWLRLTAQLYHCTEEHYSDIDLYALKITVEDYVYITGDDHHPEGLPPMYIVRIGNVKVRAVLPNVAKEIPQDHIPHDGDYGYSPGSVGFSWYGAGFSLQLPGQQVTYRVNNDTDYVAEWTCTHGIIPGIGGRSWTIFTDYANFWIGFNVPDGYKPACYVYAEAIWHLLAPPLTGFKHFSESLYWAVVDPPGAVGPSNPIPAEPLDDIETIPMNASLSWVSLYSVNLYVNETFTSGGSLEVRFFTYSGVYQANSTILRVTTPMHLILSVNVPHPLGLPVEIAVALFTDDLGNMQITGFMVYRSHLFGRVTQIIFRWAFASAAERITLFKEIVDISKQWPYTPA